MMPPLPLRYLRIHNVLSCDAICKTPHQLWGVFIRDCLYTDLITIRGVCFGMGFRNMSVLSEADIMNRASSGERAGFEVVAAESHFQLGCRKIC